MNNGRDCEHGRRVGNCDSCDLAQAEKRIAELEAERDALAAELAALSTFRDEVVDVMSQSQGVVGWHKNHQVALWDELFPVVPDFEAPRQHLAEIRAEAGRAGYLAATYDYEQMFEIECQLTPEQAAKEYAAKVRQGGE